jgi:hypothetical protein
MGNFGLGVMIQQDEGERVISHTGGIDQSAARLASTVCAF